MIRLFIAGQNIKLNKKFEKFQDFLNKNSDTHHEFEIIDVLNNPRAADEAHIFATPTIVMDSPQHSKRDE